MTPPRAREAVLEARDLVAQAFGIMDRIVGRLEEPERSACLLLRDEAVDRLRAIADVLPSDGAVTLPRSALLAWIAEDPGQDVETVTSRDMTVEEVADIGAWRRVRKAGAR